MSSIPYSEAITFRMGCFRQFRIGNQPAMMPTAAEIKNQRGIPE